MSKSLEHYSVRIFWSHEDSAYLACVPELPGLMVHGDSQEEVLETVKDTVADWIEVAKAEGRKVPPPMHYAARLKWAEKMRVREAERFQAAVEEAAQRVAQAVVQQFVEQALPGLLEDVARSQKKLHGATAFPVEENDPAEAWKRLGDS